MRKEGFGELMSLGKAVDVLLASAKKVSSEQLQLIHSRNRVLAQDVRANIDVPHFNRSAMDGFAVKGSDTFSASQESPVTLKLIENIHTGDLPRKKITRGTCAEIATGGVMPDGADSV
ncbi:MAG: hypothetical protein ABIH42_05225, partial [Planctomycetota bacterium]